MTIRWSFQKHLAFVVVIGYNRRKRKDVGIWQEPEESKTVDEKIMEAEQLIQKKQEELAFLKKDLESLKKEKQEADLQKLYATIIEKGMTVEEVVDLIK